MARIFSGDTLINTIFSVYKGLNAMGAIKEAIIIQDVFKDLYQCMYFVDDWEAECDEECDENLFDTKVGSTGSTVMH